MNWRGRPLESHQVVVKLIGATTNRKGLKVRAELDQGLPNRDQDQRRRAGGGAHDRARLAGEAQLHDPPPGASRG